MISKNFDSMFKNRFVVCYWLDHVYISQKIDLDSCFIILRYCSLYFVSINFIAFIIHCVKTVQIRSFFWSVFCIQFKHGKKRTRKNSVFGHFSHSVFISWFYPHYPHFSVSAVGLILFWFFYLLYLESDFSYP